MIESLIYFSPLLFLLVAILILIFSEHEEDEQYYCFKFSRIMLLLSFLLAVIFYNKPRIAGLSVGTGFVLLFQTFLYIQCFALLYLSRKWFAAMRRLAYVFCGCLFMALLFGNLLVASTNLVLTVVSLIMLMVGNYILLADSDMLKENKLGVHIYLFLIVASGILLSIATGMFYHWCGVLDYEVLHTYIELHKDEVQVYMAVAAIVVPFLFMLGLAPLHFCITETLGKISLPVFTYLLLVPITAVWGGFIHLNVNALSPLLPEFRLFYIAVALLSVGIGAIGANSGQNIRKIFAYASVYHVGIAFLTLRRFTLNAVNSSCVYLLAYLLAMYGICTCLFGLRKKGEYLFMRGELEGAAQKQPYLAALMTVFMFSLIGLPPFLGFLGIFSSLNYLALHHHFYQLIYLLIMILALGYAYMQVIKMLYSEERKAQFDRADRSIYAALIGNICLMLILVLFPHYLMQDMGSMLETVFP